MSDGRRPTEPWKPDDDITADRLEMMRVLAEAAQLSAAGKNVRIYKNPLGGTAIAVDEAPPPGRDFYIRLLTEDASANGHFSWVMQEPSNGILVDTSTNSYSGGGYIYTARPSNKVGGVLSGQYLARSAGTDGSGNPVYIFECHSDFGGIFRVTASAALAAFAQAYSYTMEEADPNGQIASRAGNNVAWAWGGRTITAYSYREAANGQSTAPGGSRLGIGIHTSDFSAAPLAGNGYALKPVPTGDWPHRVYRSIYYPDAIPDDTYLIEYWFDFGGHIGKN